jgi:hypothetical protein
MELLKILPEKNTYEGIVEIYRLVNLLRLTDDEAIQIEVQHNDQGGILFNQEKAIILIVDIPIGEWMTNTIRKGLRDLDDASELDVSVMSLYDKFIVDYE